MKGGQLIGAIAGAILKVAIAAILVVVIYNMSLTAYNYGYRIFGEPPVSEGEGRVVMVTIPDGKSVKEIGEILVENGLLRDATLFQIQEKVSAYKDKLNPGIYEFSTSMTAEEMMAIMAENTPADIDEDIDEDVVGSGDSGSEDIGEDAEGESTDGEDAGDTGTEGEGAEQ